MSCLVDSDWLVDAFIGVPAAVSVLARLRTDGLAVSIISYGELFEGAITAPDSQADRDRFRQLFCRTFAAGAAVVAAGNSKVDASTQVPAAYDEVITVSALADSDGQPGGLFRYPGMMSTLFLAIDLASQNYINMWAHFLRFGLLFAVLERKPLARASVPPPIDAVSSDRGGQATSPRRERVHGQPPPCRCPNDGRSDRCRLSPTRPRSLETTPCPRRPVAPRTTP